MYSQTLNAFLISLLTALISTQAQAQLDLQVQRGREILSLPGSGRSTEFCILPNAMASATYTKSDLKNEAALCSLNRGDTAAVCPKLESTNPGLNFYTVPEGMTSAQAEAMGCEMTDSKGKKLSKKVGKYKLSTSCSYSPSLLAYYHISRYLGNVLNVPPAVIRTVDVEDHKAYGNLARAKIKKEGHTGQVIDLTWGSLLNFLNAGSASKKFKDLMTDDATQTFGALQKNPSDEEKYGGDFFNGGSGLQRTINFRDKNKTFQLLKNPTFRVGREWNQNNVQTFQQMVDASNMVIMDTLLNQEDRFGNIHYYTKYLVKTGEGANFDMKTAKNLEEVPEDLKTSALPIKEMLLKDNDCGVNRENRSRKADLLENLAQISPQVYQQLLRMDKDWANLKNYFQLELLMTPTDMTAISSNLKHIVKVIKEKCSQGKLVQSLDMHLHFSGASLPKYSCELVP